MRIGNSYVQFLPGQFSFVINYLSMRSCSHLVYKRTRYFLSKMLVIGFLQYIFGPSKLTDGAYSEMVV